MSVLVPFKQCIARPTENGHEYLLTDHLLQVKRNMENWVADEDHVIVSLMGLAGVCHDIAKSHAEWQAYINKSVSGPKKGPAHAPVGAFLFSFLGYRLLQNEQCWEQYQVHWAWLIRDIADHHGQLKSLIEESWFGAGKWSKMDMQGIQEFICEHFDSLKEVSIHSKVLDEWISEIKDIWEEVQDRLDLGFTQPSEHELMHRIQEWRHLTTGLITGDRFDVQKTETSWLDEEDMIRADQSIHSFCHQNSHHPLSAVRLQAQQQIMDQLEKEPTARFYTLEMPTGYGKTITALKIATWFGRHQGYRKLVYVAPYLSILEQTSRVIEEAMEIGVLEHHSLSMLADGKNSSIREEQRAPQKQLAMESWAHSIVCTSFQQWSKALFPSRSQDVLRRGFLQDSVVVIDEPQIFNPEFWNLFLCGMEAMAEKYNFKILFLSATMPPFQFGLSAEPVQLSVQAEAESNRYQIDIEDKMDENTVADFLVHNDFVKQAAILNTIEDAFRVYDRLIKKVEPQQVKLVHGLMIPLHKKIEITKIQQETSDSPADRSYVVSTQVLEAGVDVSFGHVVRALSILPSIVQAAGRVNRHSELPEGKLTVVPFFRGGEKDTRKPIYPVELQKLTERKLLERTTWQESEVLPLIQSYYEEMFRQNSYETSKQAIRDAAEGRWENLVKYQPFGCDYMKLPLFVPWDSPEDFHLYPESVRSLQDQFNVSRSTDIYERYRDSHFMQELSFKERKQFMILFHYYVLNVPVYIALKVASQEDFLENRIPILFADAEYDPKMGLVNHFRDVDQYLW